MYVLVNQPLNNIQQPWIKNDFSSIEIHKTHINISGPIFKVARYGVIRDLFAIAPGLAEAMKKKLGE